MVRPVIRNSSSESAASFEFEGACSIFSTATDPEHRPFVSVVCTPSPRTNAQYDSYAEAEPSIEISAIELSQPRTNIFEICDANR